MLKSGALKGIRVADFTWALAGPLTTRFLGVHGAEVIKVESTTRLDPSRTGAPFKDGVPNPDKAVGFAYRSTNKLSVTLNLAHPKGVDIAKRIVGISDVVVENMSPGAMGRLGLGYEDLKKVKPDIIMASISILGQTGKGAEIPGWAALGAALSGYFASTGWPDGSPTGWHAGGPGDFVTPIFAAIAILAGLEYRAKTGKGLYFDINQVEVMINLIGSSVLDYVVNKKEQGRPGNRHPQAAPHGVFRCKGDDKWCTIAVFTDEEWLAFCKVIGNPPWTKESKFATLSLRKEHEGELEHLVESWTVKYYAEEVMEAMVKSGVSAGIVEDASDLMEDPQLREREFWVSVDHPAIGPFKYPGMPFKLSRTPQAISPAPLLGQHNKDVLTGLLGISEVEIAKLTADGIIG